MNHLIDGIKKAIESGIQATDNFKRSPSGVRINEQYVNKMKTVLHHYEFGGTIFNRP